VAEVAAPWPFGKQLANKFSGDPMAKKLYEFSTDHDLDGKIDFVRAGKASDFTVTDKPRGTWRKAKPTRFLRIVNEPGGATSGDDFKPLILWDQQEQGLRLYIGKRAATWQWFSQSRDHGDRDHTFRTLGKFDTGHYVSSGNPNKATWEPPVHRARWHMGVEEARRQARILGGKVLEGTEGTNAKEGPTFRQAFTGGFKNENGDAITGYLEYLKKHAKPTSKWPYNVERLGEQFLLKKWGDWSLIEMGKRAPAFKDWYLSLADNPTSANHCARIVRALYRRAAAHDHRLPGRDPVAVIGKKEWLKERGEQKGMSGRDLHKWYAAWQAIPNATHRSFHLVNLLIGARPGQLGGACWRDLDREAMEFTMRENTKSDRDGGNDVTIPITPEIFAAFELARKDKARPNDVGTGPDDLIFPGCTKNPTRDVLPARGHALRRTWKTIAEDHCGVPSQISEFLEGRMPEGVKGRYLLKWARSEGPKIIEAQQQISRTIMALCHGKVAKRAA
jgi:integrase